MNAIGFIGGKRFLSNFHPSFIVYKGMRFMTVEHAYQAQRALHEADKLAIQGAATPGRAKLLGSNLKELDPVFYAGRVAIMRELLELKFKNAELRARLLLTRDNPLVNYNQCGDTFWGVCKGQGRNMLGELLMDIRKSIYEGKV